MGHIRLGSIYGRYDKTPRSLIRLYDIQIAFGGLFADLSYWIKWSLEAVLKMLITLVTSEQWRIRSQTYRDTKGIY